MNSGPQHPAAHGVLRSRPRTKRGSRRTADPHIDYYTVYRKVIEHRTYLQALPFLIVLTMFL
jgi:NADH dehydrogenase (ubiquinone) Fe-S protein 2